MSGTLDIDNGGTGQTTANAALHALLLSQATHNGKFLQTNGTNSSWQTVTTGGQVNTVVAGPGMDVDSTDPVNPEVSAKISADANNSAAIGTDGGLYVPNNGFFLDARYGAYEFDDFLVGAPNPIAAIS